MKYSRLADPVLYFCAAMALACASGSGTTLAPENVDLSGSWVLNTELSDNPQQMMEEGGMPGGGIGGRPGGIGGGRPPGGMEGGRPPGGMGGRGGMGGGAPSDADMRRIQQTMRLATEAPRRIVLEQQDSTITFRNGDGRTLVLRTNWEKVTQEVADDVKLDIRARWEGRELHVERDVQGGGKVFHTYYVSPDTHRLHVESHLEMGRSGQERVFHYVYDSVQNQS